MRLATMSECIEGNPLPETHSRVPNPPGSSPDVVQDRGELRPARVQPRFAAGGRPEGRLPGAPSVI